ncbi:MAG: methionyl-tRNA formyltransferase [Phycisphaerae bacterium]|jgi:methionyl-tRNA formyltransferase
MRILFLGSGEFAIPTLRHLADSDHKLALVITQPARPSGRGRRTTPTPVSLAACQLGLETLEVEDINQPEIVTKIRSLDARLGLAIAFGQMLGPDVLESTPGGCINLHASLLPKYRGAAPINWAIIQGEKRTGCTVFKIVKRMDAGPILVSRWTEIRPQETAGELHDRLAVIGVDAVDAALDLYQDNRLPEGTPQDDSNATKAPKLKKSDGPIGFDRPAAEIVRHVHGMTPWPGASARYQSADQRWEKVNVTRIRQAEDPSAPTIAPGTIDDRRYVAAADAFLEILEIKPSSGRMMTWPDYVNGRHVAPGDQLLTP